MANVYGRISSVQTMGTLDGPGVRFVAFLQGCPLQCACCHNPETWDARGGSEISAAELVGRAARYREYFGERGGITLSGGEPLMQPEFCAEVLRLCHAEGIGTCLDTSGCLSGAGVLEYADYCLLDIKYTDAKKYRKHTGCEYGTVLEFLDELDRRGVTTRLRQVIIPGLNDDEENARRLGELRRKHRCIDEVELLPFRRLCIEKYERMGIKFPLADTPEPSRADLTLLQAIVDAVGR